jgi:hypothetical protein
MSDEPEIDPIEVAKETLRSGGEVATEMLPVVTSEYFMDGWWDDIGPFPLTGYESLSPGHMKVVDKAVIGAENWASHVLNHLSGGHGLALETEPRVVLAYRKPNADAIGFKIGYSVA